MVAEKDNLSATHSNDYQELAVKLGLNADYYGTYSMRRTKATLIYAKTKNIRPVQILLGPSKLDNTIRYLGVELEDALRLSEQTDRLGLLIQAFFLKSLCLCPKSSGK